MKASRYNSIIRIGHGRSLIYNALSDKFVVHKCEATQTIEEIIAKSPEIESQLIKCGMLIDVDTDEVAAVKEIIDRVDNDESILILTINPTLDCNFRCWYCYENHVAESAMSEQTLSAVKNLISQKLTSMSALKHLQLSFFGGEPLLRFDECVLPIIRHAKTESDQAGVSLGVSFTSNGYLLNTDRVCMLNGFDPFFQITLDGGKAFHDKTRFGKGGTPSYDVIVSNIKQLVAAGVRVLCRVNYTADNCRSIDSIIESFADVSDSDRGRLTVDFQRVWQERPSSIASKEESEIDAVVRNAMNRFGEAGFGVSYHKPMSGVYDTCYGDKKNHILINFNGDVFNCTARDFKTENRTGYLTDQGEVVYEHDSLRKRMSVKFSKPVCQDCRIAPLCAGGCRQQGVEHADSDECTFKYSESEKDEIVLNRFENLYVK